MKINIKWKYFFGWRAGRRFANHYKARVNGKDVERCGSHRGRWYSIGNIDESKKKYKTEEELIKACYE